MPSMVVRGLGAESSGGSTSLLTGGLWTPFVNFFLTSVRQIDARTVEVIFNKRVDVGDALWEGHYTIPGATVIGVQMVSPVVFLLTTSYLITDGVYDLTASGIHAEDGTLI